VSAVLLRTDGSGEALQLDGVVGYRGAPGVLVAQHPVQRLGVVVDHAQRLATSFGVEWVVSMTPTIPGITAGPDRLAEVLGWLDEAIGVPLSLVQPNLPPDENLFLTGYTYEQRGTLALSVSLAFVRAQIATTRTFDPDGLEGATTPPGQTARPDSAAGRAPTADRGNQPTQEKSAIAAGVDAVSGFFFGE
jgi:hypothetical protein